MFNRRPRFKLGEISASKTEMKGTPESHRKAQVKTKKLDVPTCMAEDSEVAGEARTQGHRGSRSGI